MLIKSFDKQQINNKNQTNNISFMGMFEDNKSQHVGAIQKYTNSHQHALTNKTSIQVANENNPYYDIN